MNAIYGIEQFHARKENYQVIKGDVNENADVCIIASGVAGSIQEKNSVIREGLLF